MITIVFTWVMSWLLSPSPSYALEKDCTYTREYITTLEYLRSKKDFAIPEAQARTLGLKVSKGCTGAAQKFIKIVSTLTRSGLSTNDSIQLGLEFSSRPDAEAETFISVFLRSFLQEYLDMDLHSSLHLARTLSTEFKGDALAALDDFQRMVDFCVREKELDLPRPQCATFAARIAHLGEKFSGGISEPFIRTFSFLRSKDGPALTTTDALQLAERLMRGGKDSSDNFIQAYKFGISHSGLNATVREATLFAQQIALPE